MRTTQQNPLIWLLLLLSILACLIAPQQGNASATGSKATIAGLTTGITTDTNTSGALTKAWNSQQLQNQVGT